MDKFTLVILFILLSDAASDAQILTVPSGQNVTLPCQTADVIRAVEWTRPDLEPEYVLFYTNRHSDPTHQHRDFQDRVELVNRELKDGDVSLTLKNVNNKDTGKYECRVAAGFRRTKRSIIDSEPIRIIHLQVTDRGPQNENPAGGNPRVYVGLGAASGLLFLVLVSVEVFVVWRNKKPTDKKSEPAADEASDKTLI